jgi:hypothetical protein
LAEIGHHGLGFGSSAKYKGWLPSREGGDVINLEGHLKKEESPTNGRWGEFFKKKFK